MSIEIVTTKNKITIALNKAVSLRTGNRMTYENNHTVSYFLVECKLK